MWSVGCIFGELLGRKPLLPGKDYIHQLHLITDVIGTPAEEDIEYVESEKARRYIRSLPYKPKIPPEKIYPNANPQAIELLEQMLVFNPAKRVTVEAALAHPYLASLHDPSDEPLAHAAFSFEFENQPLDKRMMKELIAKEMAAFHPDAPWTVAELAAGGSGALPAAGGAAATEPPPPTLPGDVPPAAPSDAAKDSPMDFTEGGKGV